MPARAGYPTSWGSSRAAVVTITGPASYTQFTAPSAGGQDINVEAQAGIKFVDFAIGGSSNDGTHRAEVVHYEAGVIRGVTVTDAVFVLKWYVIATGAEVAGGFDLSAQIIRVLVVGPK